MSFALEGHVLWRLCWLVALLSLGGCVGPRAFIPATHVLVPAPDGGIAAAEYDLDVEQHRLGQARVWSLGAYRDDSSGETRTLIHVGFVLHNSGEAPLRLDEKGLYLDDVVLEDSGLYRIAPLHVDSNTSVPPDDTQRIGVLFSLPGAPMPSEIRSYRVAWAVQAGGRTYTQQTPFVQAPPRERRYPYAVYYYGYWPYPWWPPYYDSPYYRPYPYWRYWRGPYPPGPLPPSYLRRRHR